MTTRRGRPGTAHWPRGRLVLLLTSLVLVAAVLLGGLSYATYDAISAPGRTPTDTAEEPADPNHADTRTGGDSGKRDAIAAEPMLTVSSRDARPTIPAAHPAPPILIPPATGTAPADIPTGFPHTPEGAVGQLAAITTSVLTHMSLPYTHQVHHSWALPGAVTAGQWPLTQGVQAFLGATNQSLEKEPSVLVTAIPAGGMVKGTDGPDWVLGCVLLEVRATITVEARIGYGHCARLQWHHGRWMIAPGAAPATAPSTWPGSDRAAEAGWRTWVEAR